MAQPGKEYEYGPLGYNNEDANTMNNLGNCNCLLDDKKYKKPKNQKNRPKLVEGYVNINGSVSPSEFINDNHWTSHAHEIVSREILSILSTLFNAKL